MQFQHAQAVAMDGGSEEEGGEEGSSAALPHEPFVRESKKVGRNEPCPCGSGKKFKQCHGKIV
jgi:preprotein translocase subunit SecA